MLFSQDIGIDLGTANTLVFVKGKGIIIREPSVVAMDQRFHPARVVAVGAQAKEMIGRTPGSVSALHPIQSGVIADFDATAELLRRFIRRATNNSPFNRARVMVCVPSGVTEFERRAVNDAVKSAGAKYISIIEAPLASAIGAGLPIGSATGSMVVDIGGGTSEVAVIALKDIVTSLSIKVAGDSMDEAIINYVKKKYSLLIGERTAEELKIKLGSAHTYDGEGAMNVKGRNLVDGLPMNVEITSEEIREALSDTVQQIVDMIRTALEITPPELAADIMDNGITLTGGGALLRGIDKHLQEALNIPVTVADTPIDCAADGIGVCLEKKL